MNTRQSPAACSAKRNACVFRKRAPRVSQRRGYSCYGTLAERAIATDRKSTRLNSSHVESSYAAFCVKKKKKSLSDMLKRKGCILRQNLLSKRVDYSGSSVI